ncbi:cofilin/tropomyosin-type actin-binding protein [Elsinoe australis]|uniref:Cofilin/tropomyosin-type actin-binding protein n=1 Tax=Elsinoe australis TaxID=40998 RepID=A0A4U7B790_9PEZI|nr:cofilin/tropomyosin-type actin-binding protein [Elsinoe australis]
MQSGIKASTELKSAFNELVSSSSSLALFATITNETLVPGDTIPSNSTFPSSLSQLTPLLSPKTATYILVKTDGSKSDGYLAITFVPDAAPVRQKMLFASTRTTLVRELGIERFGESIFCTNVEEVSPEGWERHLKHQRLENPLTEEERANEGIREAEMLESSGTGGREMGGMGMGGAQRSSTGTKGLRREEGLEGKVGEVKGGGEGVLVTLKIDVPNETLQVDKVQSGISAASLKDSISHDEPRYSFFTYTPPGESEAKIIFLYTCPSGSKIKERMVYASSRISVVKMAENELGLTIAKRLEGSSPTDFPEEVIKGEFVQKQEESKGFARPKRPGRR